MVSCVPGMEREVRFLEEGRDVIISSKDVLPSISYLRPMPTSFSCYSVVVRPCIWCTTLLALETLPSCVFLCLRY
jgi:hypothetical protein